jgi:hypothetical protein
MADNLGKRVTVSRVWNDKSFKRVPMIRLRGDWLEAFGFQIGDVIELIYSFEDSCLIIKKVN